MVTREGWLVGLGLGIWVLFLLTQMIKCPRFISLLPSQALQLFSAFFPLLIFESRLLLTHLSQQRRREEVRVVH